MAKPGYEQKVDFLHSFFPVLVVGFFYTLKAIIPGYGVRKFSVLNQVKPFSF